MYSIEDAARTIDQATNCTDHPGKCIPADEIESVVYFEDTADRNVESSRSIAVCKLKNGQWALAQEWSDYTGHGCKCTGTLELFDSKQDLISCGFDAEQRKRIAI